jgi:hypothetical protein
VEGTLRAIRQLFQRTDAPDWFVLLSGADYPIKPAVAVYRDLGDPRFDAHVWARVIDSSARGKTWQEVHFLRYLTPRASLPCYSLKRGFNWRSVRLPRWIPFSAHPFHNGFRCFGGSQWFSANRDAAACILRESERCPAFNRFCRKIPIPDEMYFQTLLMNSKGMRINDRNYRYTDWSVSAMHPKTLDMDDLPALLQSPCHFARKFSIERSEVMDAIDREIDQRPSELAARSVACKAHSE